MLGAGLGLKLAHMRNNKPSQECTRCGLRYTIDNENCPHCRNLSDSQLLELKKEISNNHEANKRLGKVFFIIAIAITVLMILFLL